MKEPWSCLSKQPDDDADAVNIVLWDGLPISGKFQTYETILGTLSEALKCGKQAI